MDARDDRRSMPSDPESKGCLLVVAGYADVAQAVEPVAVEAASRILMSPTLGDFVELRFVDIGPRPQQPGQNNAAVALIADELTRPGNGAAQNYFALEVVDRSAAAVEQVLGDCRLNPVVAALPLRCRGVATRDDRQPGAKPAGGMSTSPDVRISQSGRWTRDQLVGELRLYAEDLLNDFATSHEPGLTYDQLALIRTSNEEDQITGSADDADKDLLEQRPAVPLAIESASLLKMAPSAEKPPPSVSPPSTPEPADTAPASAPAARGGSRRPMLRRLRRSRSAESAAEGQAIGEENDPPTVLAFLLIVGDDSPDDHAPLRRSRSLLLEVDQKISAIPGAVYKVRGLHSAGDTAQSTLRPPGQLSRREMKRAASSFDFTRSLAGVRTVLRRDLAVLARSATSVARPAIVLFAVDAPLADAVTVEVYDELVREASVIWVVPERSSDLMSPAFAAADARILTDHRAVADEVINLLNINTESLRPLEVRESSMDESAIEASPPSSEIMGHPAQGEGGMS
jgi:hypothetical protein